MHIHRLLYLALACTFAAHADLVQRSITGNMPTYLQACVKAATDPSRFDNFRRDPDYAGIVECGSSGEFSQHLLHKGSPDVFKKIKALRKLDRYGNPVVNDLPILGKFSGTTLRYIVIADHIKKLFKLPEQAKIVEIGAGFGGQCYILSQLSPFSRYFIYDLPEVELLIGKMMHTLSVPNVTLLALNYPLPQEKVDLVISNYAFSECDRQTQIDYIKRVISKADRGYMIYNQLSHISNIDSLSAADMVVLLAEHGVYVQVHPEPVFTFEGNVLIVWDKTREL